MTLPCRRWPAIRRRPQPWGSSFKLTRYDTRSRSSRGESLLIKSAGIDDWPRRRSSISSCRTRFNRPSAKNQLHIFIRFAFDDPGEGITRVIRDDRRFKPFGDLGIWAGRSTPTSSEDLFVYRWWSDWAPLPRLRGRPCDSERRTALSYQKTAWHLCEHHPLPNSAATLPKDLFRQLPRERPPVQPPIFYPVGSWTPPTRSVERPPLGCRRSTRGPPRGSVWWRRACQWRTRCPTQVDEPVHRNFR